MRIKVFDLLKLHEISTLSYLLKEVNVINTSPHTHQIGNITFIFTPAESLSSNSY